MCVVGWCRLSLSSAVFIEGHYRQIFLNLFYPWASVGISNWHERLFARYKLIVPLGIPPPHGNQYPGTSFWGAIYLQSPAYLVLLSWEETKKDEMRSGMLAKLIPNVLLFGFWRSLK